MLLTNTINAQTIVTTIATGNVTVCDVASRGCSALPAPCAAHPVKSSFRRGKRAQKQSEAAEQSMYCGELLSWRDRWLHRLDSHSAASIPAFALGFASGCSLS